MAKKTAVKEYVSDWFIAGLEEIGLSEAEYQKMSQKEKNEVREYLAEFGHC